MAQTPDLVFRRQIHELAQRVAALETSVFGAAAEEPTASADPSTAPPPQTAVPVEPPAVPALPRPVGLPAERTNAEPARSAFEIERLIGGRAFAVLGALAVVVAAALFLKLAYDQGWLGRLPDVWKCALSAGFGFALLSVGEGVLRRCGRVASMGLTAAGLGVVYASAYAAYGFYDLVSAPAAFALLAGVVAMGIGLSARARRLPVAILSTAAGYAIPFVLHASGPAFVLPAHLLAMLVVALGLCARVGHSFAPVRALAWWTTLVLGTVWAGLNLHEHPALTLGFGGVFWAMVHAELIWSCLRDDRREQRQAIDPNALAHRPLEAMIEPFVRPMLASFSLTAWAALLGSYTLDYGFHTETWYATGTMLFVTTLLWLTIGRGLGALRGTPQNRIAALGVSLAAQAGALLIVTGSLALTGFTESVAGLIFGVAAALAAWRLDLRAFRIYGLVVLALATLRLLCVDFSHAMGASFAPAFDDSWRALELGPVLLTRWTLLAALGAAAWIVAALLSPAQHEDERAAFDRPVSPRAACAAVAAALLVLGFVSKDVSATGLFAAWLACGVAFAYALRPFGHLVAGLLGVGAWTLSALAWVAAWPPHAWSVAAAPFTHPGFLTAGVLLAGILLIRRSTPRERGESPGAILRSVAAGLGLLVVFAASSTEAARIASIVFEDSTAKYATLTVWWAVFATSLILSGFVRAAPTVRHLGLALLFAAAGKAVLYDLAEVEPAWRIASFLGVGLFMLGVATGYTRIARSARRAETTPA